ncbi:hypothetical protein [Nocardia stercoris]|uniref:Uncharacterized protein n=1 Tax=Nocardia stercoris TaxID=2483361 RepID=A0A3M2L8C5_9NOCA|nr:hypothetical protein [Nocardia stercoris]RMI33286.1 hypothetical protein EBN03_08890 [Nocardia stercoris]
MTLSPAHEDWVPSACTLATAEQPIRVAELDRFFATSVRAVRRRGPARLEVIVDAGAGAWARDLAGRESRCCSVFGFDFTDTADDVVMGVAVAAAHREVLDAFAARAESRIGARR